MHSRKRVAQPQEHSIRFYKTTNAWEWCPFCEVRIKTVHAKSCLPCKADPRRTVVSKDIFYIEDEPCRWIALTQNQKTIVSESDYVYLSQWYWYASYDPSIKGFYATRKVCRKSFTMHRQIMGKSKKFIDHKNHNTLDNRRNNLRFATVSQSSANERKPSTNTSGYKGVYTRNGGRTWRVIITKNRKNIHPGKRFPTAKEAAYAYDDLARQLFGEFAHANFPIISD